MNETQIAEVIGWTCDEYDERLFSGQLLEGQERVFWDHHCIRCGASGAPPPRPFMCRPCVRRLRRELFWGRLRHPVWAWHDRRHFRRASE